MEDGQDLVILLSQFNPVHAHPILTNQSTDFPLGGLVLGSHPDVDGEYGVGDVWKVLYLTNNAEYVNVFKAMQGLDAVVQAEKSFCHLLAGMLADAARLGNPTHRKKRRK